MFGLIILFFPVFIYLLHVIRRKYFIKPKNLNGQTVFITGGANGLGKALAFEFLKKGAKVAICDIDQEQLDLAIREAKSQNLSLYGYILDVTKRDQVFDTAAKIKKEVGAVDILVNNAGIIIGKKLLDLSEREFQLTMNVNAISHLWTVQAFFPDMIQKGGGTFVSVCSSASFTGVPRMGDYGASKAAAFIFADSLRSELKKDKHPIDVLIVCPGYMKTTMFAGFEPKGLSMLAPNLDPQDVAREIIIGIETRESHLLLPRTLNVLFLLRLLPIWLYDSMNNILGVWNVMNNFTGNKKNK